jgi:amino acid adenylation domain-containing protein
MQGSEVDRRLARCRERLAGVAPLNLPLDRPRPARHRFLGSMLPITIDSATGHRLRRIATDHDATLFQLLAAVYAYWLRSYTEQDDVVFATAHDFRQAPELESMAGYCLTPVVLRISVAETSTCIGLLTRMRTEVLDAIGCAVPFERLVRTINLRRDQQRNPLVHTALVLEPAMLEPDPTWSIDQMETAVGALVGQSKLDISVALAERSDGRICGRLTYNADLFETCTAQLMQSHFVRLLRNVTTAPDLPLAELSGPDEQDRRRQLNEFNPKPLPAATAAQDRCIHELIVDRATRSPDKVAVVVGDQKLSYRDLLGRSQQIAARLTEAGAGPGVVVAICVDRSIQLVPALLGVLLSGGAYLPLDPNQPESRSLFMTADAGATVLLTDSIHRLQRAPSDIEVVDLSRDTTQCSDAMAPAFIPENCSPQDLAYVIYTSGSTGTPKGVQVEHRSVVNLMMALPAALRLSDADTFLSVVSYAFDGSVGDMFTTLALGATLVLATDTQTKDPRELAELVDCCKATAMSATPTTWSMLIGVGWSGRPGLLAVCGGERLTDWLARELRQRCRAVWNGWGPTEATVFAGGGFVEAGEPVTVGKPLPGVRIYVMDNRGRLLSCGVPGEIVIAGRGVSRGYVNRPEETAQRYRPDPFVDGDRMYRTGDRGRLLADGRLQHLGRYDDQAKIRGFRIELAEIESALCEHPEVRACAVVAREAPSGEQHLVAYIVGASACLADAEARDWLRRRLPEYMVPKAFVHLSALPMTANGKLDKAALPAPSPQRTARPGDQPPRNDTERRVAALWADLLGVPVTDVNCDFFDIGGHSLLAARLISEIQRTFGVPLPLAAFLDNGRTVAGLAALLGAESPARTEEGDSGSPPLHFIFADLASAMRLRHFTAQWGAAQPVHALVPEQPGGRFDRSVTIEQHASQALSMVRDRQPDGALALVGFSIGGLVAYEVARQAVDAGQQVDWLGILDLPAPSMAQLLRAQQTLRWRLRRTRQLPAHERRAKLGEVAFRVLQNGPGGLLPQGDFDYRGVAEIACRYQQPGHEVPMHLFVTEGTAADVETDGLGWDGFHKGTLTMHRLAGNHNTLLDQPQVEQVTRMVLKSLREAQATATAQLRQPVATDS